MNIRLHLVGLLSIGIAVFAPGCQSGDREHHHHHPDSAHSGQEAGGHDHQDDAADAHGASAATTKLSFSSSPAVIPVGRPATWTLTIVDAATGRPVEKFDTVHEKLLHLIVVSSDLSWFNHIHPAYAGNGVFTVKATLPRAGTYRLYADYTPEGASQEVPQQEIATDGAQPAPAVLPAADTLGEGGWMVKHVTAKPEGMPDISGGAEYEVALMPMPSKIVVGKDVMLHFQVRDRSGKPIDDLEPYLGALGHAVILSSDARIYLHTHPMEGGMEGMDHGAMNHTTGGDHAAPRSGGSDVMFHTSFPAPGLYKVWGQFQHKGKIVTASFMLVVDPA